MNEWSENERLGGNVEVLKQGEVEEGAGRDALFLFSDGFGSNCAPDTRAHTFN